MRSPTRVLLNKKGFSLIEMMIAIAFIMVSMLALLAAIINAMGTNLQNDLRDTAVRLTNQTAEVILSLPLSDSELAYGNHSRNGSDVSQTQKGLPQTEYTIRGYRQAFTINWTVVRQTDKVKEITITVGYNHKGQNFSNSAVIYKHEAI